MSAEPKPVADYDEWFPDEDDAPREPSPDAFVGAAVALAVSALGWVAVAYLAVLAWRRPLTAVMAVLLVGCSWLVGVALARMERE